MNETETAVVTVDPTGNLPAPTFGAQMQLQSLANALEFAAVVEKSGLAPKGMNREGIVIAMQMGYEVGLSPMQAIQNIASINGRPAIWGDAQLALVRASGLLESYAQEPIGEPGTDGRGYKVTVQRAGSPAASEEFTVADAKRAGLWGKQGPWTQYPQRMTLFRARGFILRDQFGDVLKGLKSAEEVMDEPREIDVTAVGTDTPSGPPAAAAKMSRRRTPKTEATVTEPAKPATEAAPAEAAAADTANPEPLNPTPADIRAALGEVGMDEALVLEYLAAQVPPRIKYGGTVEDIGMKVARYIVDHPNALANLVTKWQADRDEAAQAEANEQLDLAAEGTAQE